MTVEKILSKLTAVDGKEYYLLTSLHNGGEAGMDLALVRDNQAWTGTGTVAFMFNLTCSFVKYLPIYAMLSSWTRTSEMLFMYFLFDTAVLDRDQCFIT